MISRLFRPSLVPSRLLARSAGGWERPDPPIMVKYENRRTLGLINKFLHKNDGVAPVYIINDYSNQATLTERYYNFFYHSLIALIFISPIALGVYFFGRTVPQFLNTGALDVERIHNKWVAQGKYQQIRKNNPYGIDVQTLTPPPFVFNQDMLDCNAQHTRVRQQGRSYIQKLSNQVINDIQHQPRKPNAHH